MAMPGEAGQRSGDAAAGARSRAVGIGGAERGAGNRADDLAALAAAEQIAGPPGQHVTDSGALGGGEQAAEAEALLLGLGDRAGGLRLLLGKGGVRRRQRR